MWTDDGRTTVIIENTHQETLRVTFWKEQQDLCKQIGMEYKNIEIYYYFLSMTGFQ